MAFAVGPSVVSQYLAPRTHVFSSCVYIHLVQKCCDIVECEEALLLHELLHSDYCQLSLLRILLYSVGVAAELLGR